MSLIPVLFGWPLALLPGAHRLPGADHRPGLLDRVRGGGRGGRRDAPAAARPAASGCSARRTLGVSLVQGVAVLAAVAAHVRVGAGRAATARTRRGRSSFTTLIVANLGLIFVEPVLDRRRSCRGSGRRNRALWWVTGGAAAFLACALYVPVLREVFHFAQLSAADVACAWSSALASVLWFDAAEGRSTAGGPHARLRRLSRARYEQLQEPHEDQHQQRHEVELQRPSAAIFSPVDSFTLGTGSPRSTSHAVANLDAWPEPACRPTYSAPAPS